MKLIIKNLAMYLIVFIIPASGEDAIKNNMEIFESPYDRIEIYDDGKIKINGSVVLLENLKPKLTRSKLEIHCDMFKQNLEVCRSVYKIAVTKGVERHDIKRTFPPMISSSKEVRFTSLRRNTARLVRAIKLVKTQESIRTIMLGHPKIEKGLSEDQSEIWTYRMDQYVDIQIHFNSKKELTSAAVKGIAALELHLGLFQ